jgi:hypothetical protein
MSLEAAGKTTFTGSLTATGPGATHIRVRATYDVPGGTNAAEDSVFLTIGDKASAFGIQGKPILDTAPIDRAPCKARCRRNGARSDETARAQGIGRQALSCVTGGWFFRTTPARSGVHQHAGGGVDGGTRAPTAPPISGHYNLCFDNIPSGRNVSVRFVTMNNLGGCTRRGRATTSSSAVARCSWRTGDSEIRHHRATRRTTAPVGARLLERRVNRKPGYRWDALDSVCGQLVINWSPS